MVEAEQDWHEYKRMILDWHEDDIKSRDRVDAALEQMNLTLVEIKAERRAWHWALGVVVPAVVSFFVASASKALGR